MIRVSITSINTIFILFVVSKTHATDLKIEHSYAQSIIGMVPLLSTERELIANMESYVTQLREKMNFIKLISNELQAEYTKSKIDPEKYLSNPLKRFTLVRRMHSDWDKWQKFMQQEVGKSQIDFIEQMHTKLPTAEDFEEAVNAIVRLQYTYELSIDNLVTGIFNGKQYDAKLSLLDCYAISEHHNNKHNMKHANNWLNATLKLHRFVDEKTNDILGAGIADIWHLMADTLYFLQKYEECENAINLAYEHRKNDEEIYIFKHFTQAFVLHEKLCRGNIVSTREKLHCRYNSTTHPFLKLAPLKMEILAEDPYLVLYHDVLYHNEIEELKRLSISKLTRGFVGLGHTYPGRTAQKHVLISNENVVTARIDRRIFDMTGFDTSADPKIQMINYGLGGHYLNHVDYYNLTQNPEFEKVGERIGSVLFYLSDVKLGGATAFPHIEKFIAPKKGAAIFWHHLDELGNGNHKSMHASCPMVFGSKWVLIKMLSERVQMFIKPCPKNVKVTNTTKL